MKKESIEFDYKEMLDLKFIEKVGSPFNCDFPILGTDRKVKPIANKKILVIRLEPCAELYALNNSVTYLTDNKEKYDKFLNTVNHEKFGSDDSAILFNDWKNIDKLMENKKFDVCVMNPPYNKNLHIEILSKVVNYCDIVINISPSKIFTNPYIEYEKHTKEYKYRLYLSKFLTSMDVMSTDMSNSLFDTNFYHTLAISTFNRNVDEVFNLSQFESKNTLVNKLVKTVSQMQSLRSKFTKPQIDKWFVPVRRTNHSYLKWAEHDFNKIKAVDGINFNTEEERKNFINSFDSWLYNFLNKTNWPGRENSASVPFMQDYSLPWTDKRFCEFFNITGYISDTKAKPGSEWETILNTIK